MDTTATDEPFIYVVFDNVSEGDDEAISLDVGTPYVSFDDVCSPGYLRTGGLGSHKGGLFNAKISSETGISEYFMHSDG